MSYQKINIPNRTGADRLDSDVEVEMAEFKEPAPAPTQEVYVPEEAPKEPEVKEELEIDLESNDDFVEDDQEEEATAEEEEVQKKAKKKPGRPKGSTNKKRDKRIKQLLDKQAEKDAENAELAARLAAMEKQMFESSKASNESRRATLAQNIEALQGQLKAALEDEDTAAIVDIQNKMMQANMEFAAVNYEVENSPQEYTPSYNNTQEAKPSPYAINWIEDHPAFNEDEEFNAAALGVNAKLLKMGFDPESPEFYEELDKRLSKRYPEYFDISDSDVLQYNEDEGEDSSDSEDNIPQTVAGASRTPSGSTPGNNAKSGRKKRNTVVLTEEDQILCRKWGISPIDFAKRKKALEGKDKGDYTDIR